MTYHKNQTLVSSQAAKDALNVEKDRATEERRFRDALEDVEVREVLKSLHQEWNSQLAPTRKSR